MLRTLSALVLALHGLIHLIGFLVPFRIAELQGYAYTTSAAWGRIELGDGGARVVGVLWLLATVAFLVVAYGIWQGTSWAVPLTAVAAACSLVLCILGSPAAAAGIAVNVAILAVIALLVFVGHAGPAVQ
jgi:hypothetical protein